MPIITVSNLSKFYSVPKKHPGLSGSLRSIFSREHEEVKAVEDISFEINKGELVGFIGPNGAGKTTTLKCLSGLLYPTSGKISVLRQTPFERKDEYLKKIALVMGQKNQLWWDLPANDTFLLNKAIYEIPDRTYSKILGDLVSLLDVEKLLYTPVKKLSLGQRMKMEFIAALLHSPKVLFLDEPTIGLDVLMQKNIRDFLREYNRKYNATVILTSHYMADVEELCKRVIVINHGRLLYDGLLSDLVKKHAGFKRIKVILHSKVSLAKLKALGNVLSYSYPEVIYKTNPEGTNSLASAVLKELPVEDVTIEEPDIEEVIEDVFTAK